MKSNLNYLFLFIVLVFAQVLLFNNLLIWGYVNIFFYIYFILVLPVRMSREWLVFLGFVLGLVIDLLSNTWGINTMATTLVAYLRPYLLRMVSSFEDQERIYPNYKSMGLNFWKYAVLMVLLHHGTLFALEAFSFKMAWVVLFKTLLSSLVTLVLVWTCERIRE